MSSTISRIIPTPAIRPRRSSSRYCGWRRRAAGSFADGRSAGSFPIQSSGMAARVKIEAPNHKEPFELCPMATQPVKSIAEKAMDRPPDPLRTCGGRILSRTAENAINPVAARVHRVQRGNEFRSIRESARSMTSYYTPQSRLWPASSVHEVGRLGRLAVEPKGYRCLQRSLGPQQW